jgi:hypothetical protein
MQRGDIYWEDLRPRSGSEQQGRRPVLIVSHDGFNQTPVGVPSLSCRSQRRRLRHGGGQQLLQYPEGLGDLRGTVWPYATKSRH